MYNVSEQCIEADQSSKVDIALKAPEYDFMRNILYYHKNKQFPAYKSTDTIDNELILATKNSFNERYCLFDIGKTTS